MSDISDVETLVRYQIEDFSHTQLPGDVFTYESSAVFTLTEANPLTVSAVLINDSAIGDSEYTFDSTVNKVTVTATLTAGDTVEIQYTYYPNYSSAQIESYIRAAAVHLSVNNYCTFEVNSTDDTFYPEITDREKNLVAFVTAILINPGNVSYRLPDISFTVPKAMPTRDLVSKAISIFKNNTHGHFAL